MPCAFIAAVAVVIAVDQVGIATTIVNTLFMAMVGALALAFALAFGLGGRETAGKIVASWYQKGQDAAPKMAKAADAASSQAHSGPVPSSGVSPAPTRLASRSRGRRLPTPTHGRLGYPCSSMNHWLPRLGAALSCLLGAASTLPAYRGATDITLDVRTDLPCTAPGAWRGVAVYAGAPGIDLETRSPVLTSTSSDEPGHIGSLVLVPRAAKDEAVGIRVVAGVARALEECASASYQELPGVSLPTGLSRTSRTSRSR